MPEDLKNDAPSRTRVRESITKSGHNRKKPATLSAHALAKMHEAFPPETVIEHLRSMLDAVYTARSGVKVPDYKTRLSALKLIVDHTLGLPVQRQEIVTHSLQPMEVIKGNLAKSPALQQELLDMVEDAQTTARAEGWIGNNGGAGQGQAPASASA